MELDSPDLLARATEGARGIKFKQTRAPVPRIDERAYPADRTPNIKRKESKRFTRLYEIMREEIEGASGEHHSLQGVLLLTRDRNRPEDATPWPCQESYARRTRHSPRHTVQGGSAAGYGQRATTRTTCRVSRSFEPSIRTEYTKPSTKSTRLRARGGRRGFDHPAKTIRCCL